MSNLTRIILIFLTITFIAGVVVLFVQSRSENGLDPVESSVELPRDDYSEALQDVAETEEEQSLPEIAEKSTPIELAKLFGYIAPRPPVVEVVDTTPQPELSLTSPFEYLGRIKVTDNADTTYIFKAKQTGRMFYLVLNEDVRGVVLQEITENHFVLLEGNTIYHVPLN